jgi:Beta-propeller repeat/HYDIN/CFA65/VesB-like, Ig-like domain
VTRSQFPRGPWRLRRRTGFAVVLALASLGLWVGSAWSAGLDASRPGPAAAARGAVNYGSPLAALRFEANRGQTSRQVEFLARGRGYTLFLLPGEAVLSLRCQKSEGRSQKPERRPLSVVRGPLEKAGATGPGQGMTEHRPGRTDKRLGPPVVLRLKLQGANRRARAVGAGKLPTKVNYFLGRDPEKWRRDIPSYARVRYADVYPGIDLVYYGNQGRLEYDFVVKPGADPQAISLAIDRSGGARRAVPLRVAANGDLMVEAAGGEVRFEKPTVYQPAGKRPSTGSGLPAEDPAKAKSTQNRKLLEARYVLTAGNRVRFEIPRYDKTRPLIIDPVLSYSTYLGGSSGDAGYGIAVDQSGNVYVAGSTSSPDFPTASPEQAADGGSADAFVSKLDPTGTTLLYSTYLGGNGFDQANAIAVDASGNVYVAGSTASTDFPTAGALQSTPGGAGDAFVAKLDSTGSKLLYSTYLGGSGADFGRGIAVDSSGNAYVTGSTQSLDFPTASPLQAANAGGTDAFVSELNASGSALVYSTYLGGGGTDVGTAIAVDSAGSVYLTGHTSSTDFPATSGALQTVAGGSGDAFVAKLDSTGTKLDYATYLGGSAFDFADALAVDSSTGAAYVAGFTASLDFPLSASPLQGTAGGNGDAFVAELNASGSGLLYSTYLGGADRDEAMGVALDSAGDVYVTGYTRSSDFPSANAVQAAFPGGTCGTVVCASGFVTELNPSGGGPVYSTFLGGSGADFGQAIAVDASQNAYVTGSTSSTGFPAIYGSYQVSGKNGPSLPDAFVAKIAPASAPSLGLSPGSLDFGDEATGVTSAGQTVTLRDYGTAPITLTSVAADAPFAATDNCGGTVAPGGASCTITVTFTPTVTGQVTGNLTITDNASGGTQTVALTGNGTTPGPAVTFTPNPLDFGDQTYNTSSTPQTITLTNSGTATLNITGISTTGDFAETNNCPAAVPVGGTCTITVTFTPSSTGTIASSVTVTDDAANSPQLASLSGHGVALFSLASSPASLTVDQNAGSQTFTISASAPGTFTDSITLACSASSPTTCSLNPTSVTPGGNSTMTVSTFLGVLARPVNITLTGTSGTQSYNLTVTVNLTDFTPSLSPPIHTISAGDTTTYTLTLTPVNGFDQKVTLACAWVPSTPQATSCSMDPASLTLDGTNPATATMTVTTTKRSGFPPGSPPLFPLVPLVALGGLLAAFGLARARRWKSPAYTLPVAILILLAAFAASCNTTYNPIFQGPAYGNGTPGGIYTLVVTGTSGKVVHSATAQLGVN